MSFRFVFGRRCLPFRFVSCRVCFRVMRFIRFVRYVLGVFGLLQGLASHPSRAGRLLHFLQHKQQQPRLRRGGALRAPAAVCAGGSGATGQLETD